MGVCIGLWFNQGDPYRHVLDYKKWKEALKENALTFHAHDILVEGLQEEREPNPVQAFRPWECDEVPHTKYTTATQDEFKKVLKDLTGKEYVLTSEVKAKEAIPIVKKKVDGRQVISMKIPASAFNGGISKRRQASSTSASHRRYIASIYQMMLREAAVRDGIDPAGAWSQSE